MEKEIRTKILAKIGLLHNVRVVESSLAIQPWYMVEIDGSIYILRASSIKELGLDEAVNRLVQTYKEELC